MVDLSKNSSVTVNQKHFKKQTHTIARNSHLERLGSLVEQSKSWVKRSAARREHKLLKEPAAVDARLRGTMFVDECHLHSIFYVGTKSRQRVKAVGNDAVAANVHVLADTPVDVKESKTVSLLVASGGAAGNRLFVQCDTMVEDAYTIFKRKDERNVGQKSERCDSL